MIDALYLVGTVAFFGLMVGYLRACDRLRHRTGSSDGGDG